MTTTLEKSRTSLTLTRTLSAPIERVFRAWTDPTAITQWFTPGPQVRCHDVQMDVRLGGEYRIEMRHPDGDVFITTGEFTEIDPPNRLSFTWRCCDTEMEPALTQVTVELTSVAGGTELTLTHEKLSSEKSVEAHTKGWTGCLEGLEGYLG